MYELDFIFDTLLSGTLKNYERRDEQIQMAYEVQDALDKNDISIVEAGSGIGKSLAYLIPSILWLGKDKRIIISTYTKTLQNQLLTSDIPIAKSVLGSMVVANPAFGSENYLCRRRFKRVLSEGSFLPFQQNEIGDLVLWQKSTRSGLRKEAEKNARVTLWRDICRMPNTCIGKYCSERQNCYYEYARRKLHSSQIIITNHHLFFANLSCGGRVLPKYDAVIFDEAHNLEDIATSYLGYTITNYSFSWLLGEIKRRKIREMDTLVEDTGMVVDEFFKDISHRFSDAVTRIKQPLDIKTDELYQNLKMLGKKMGSLPADNDEERAELDNFQDRIRELVNTVDIFTNLSDPGQVYWVEKDKNRVALNNAPIDVSQCLSSTVFNGDLPVILCSATMTTGPDDFSFFREKLGIFRGKNVSIHSPFDYLRNSILYIPDAGVDPNLERYSEFLAGEAGKLVSITEGRAFLLFTSYKLMNEVYNLLVSLLPEYNLLRQGDISRETLLERFVTQKRSVLFGAYTFWQGVDIPGDSLVSVIITKLPFDVPTEPIEEARIEMLTNEGFNPFLSYQLPKAILILRQGFGRLIRNKTDYGLISILDTRIRKRSYGKAFLSALPKTNLVSTIEEVKDFFTLRQVNLKTPEFEKIKYTIPD